MQSHHKKQLEEWRNGAILSPPKAFLRVGTRPAELEALPIPASDVLWAEDSCLLGEYGDRSSTVGIDG